ncbi:tripartite tricarboxylate transporter TctB family protein [Lachnospiraceae bacterium 62-35]
MSKYKDLISGICGLIFSTALYLLSIQIGRKESTAIGADFLPKIVAVIMFAMFIIVTYRGVKQVKSQTQEKPLGYRVNYKGVAIIFAAMLIYASLLKPIGFIITSCIFLFLAICLMTKKEEYKLVKFGVITVIAVLFIYFVFMEIFGIRIPRGIL